MKIIPGLLENDFYTFANGIQKIQENMSEIFMEIKITFQIKIFQRFLSFLRKKSMLVLDNPLGDQLALFFAKTETKEKKF